MADFKMSDDHNLDLLCDVHSCSELLPLYCVDCDCPLCGDCVTRDHVGHKIRVKRITHQQELDFTSTEIAN